MATLRKIVTKSDNPGCFIEIETGVDGNVEIRFCEGEEPEELDESVFVATVVEYGIERGLLPKPRVRKDRKPRKTRKDKGTSRTAAATDGVFEDRFGSQVGAEHPDARPVP